MRRSRRITELKIHIYMAQEELNTPHTPEEIARAAQEAAVRAAMEQMQSMYGNIPGFEMPDMNDMQAQIMAQMQAAVPNLAEIQKQQSEMGTLGGIDADTVAQAARANMAQAGDFYRQMQDGSLEQELREMNALALESLGEDWTIRRSGDSRLTPEQLRLLAFGAPLLVYNDECIDTVESHIEHGTIKAQLESWWEVTDRDSTIEIVNWLLNEGHHAEADEALAILLSNEAGDDPEPEKLGEVRRMVAYMIQNEYCDMTTIPHTAIAWDLVRVVNLGRWAFLCGYVTEEEMWHIMQAGAEVARQEFSSWQEFGLSYTLGRGVWHDDTDDCDTAYEIMSLLLGQDDSPWRQITWE